jgi:hypothetical protein
MTATSALFENLTPNGGAKEALVAVLAARIDRVYMTAGSARGQRLVRQALACMNSGSLIAAVHELGLDRELDRAAGWMNGNGDAY